MEAASMDAASDLLDTDSNTTFAMVSSHLVLCNIFVNDSDFGFKYSYALTHFLMFWVVFFQLS